jgi:hypothetical protein
MNADHIYDFFSGYNFDLSVTRDARWIDQKCTPDVVAFIADCILNLDDINEEVAFTVKDVWSSEYFNKNVQFIFAKPDPDNESASSEYDKFINQPLKMLSYADILKCEKISNTNYFVVNNYEILNYISAKDINAYNFLIAYIEKVLLDSQLLDYFNVFFSKCRRNVESKGDFNDLKNKYINFILLNTPINNSVEISRIFTKVINPLAVKNSTKGTIRGRLSPGKIQYSELMYNRVNWRDVLKDKRVTRQEYDELSDEYRDADAYNKFLTQRAIAQIKRKHRASEIQDEYSAGEATQVHHIFMKHEYPNLSYSYENLIRLTPTQHLTCAHPRNNTQVIDRDYQFRCLMKKLDHVEMSALENDEFYNLQDFIFVINTGLGIEIPYETSLPDVRGVLISHYRL